MEQGQLCQLFHIKHRFATEGLGKPGPVFPTGRCPDPMGQAAHSAPAVAPEEKEAICQAEFSAWGSLMVRGRGARPQGTRPTCSSASSGSSAGRGDTKVCRPPPWGSLLTHTHGKSIDNWLSHGETAALQGALPNILGCPHVSVDAAAGGRGPPVPIPAGQPCNRDQGWERALWGGVPGSPSQGLRVCLPGRGRRLGCSPPPCSEPGASTQRQDLQRSESTSSSKRFSWLPLARRRWTPFRSRSRNGLRP